MGGFKEWVDGWMAEREVWVGGEKGQGGRYRFSSLVKLKKK
jgi:hypothetical protein